MDYEKKYKEAQKWIESIYTELSHEQQMEAEAFFPELKESKDERIRKWLIGYFNQYIIDGMPQIFSNGLNVKDVIAWLEKQGELKSIWHNEDEEPQRGSLILLIMQSGTPIVAKIIEPNHTFNHGERWAYIDDLLEKQDEQKPADKVEPKFKIKKGKWYVCIKDLLDNYANKAFREGDIYLSTQDGSLIPSNSNVPYDVVCPDTYFREWTIQDAKDGDVLACPLPKGCESGEQIFIFKSINSRDYVDNCIEYYCRVLEGEFYENKTGYMGTTSSPLYPATKEQRDTLIKAMTDAGWEFDFEKKELKKIEQKSAKWSEEDEKYVKDLVDYFTGGASLKHTEEDIANWLKSLKQRIGWKPSEEQIKTLELIINSHTLDAYHLGMVRHLYNGLKTLKE